MPDGSPDRASALIAAAGSGERLGAGGPKALVPCAGRPLVAWCVEAFARSGAVRAAVIAAPADHEDEIREAAEAAANGLPIEVIAGGATRAASVAAGLGRIDTEIVAVHDAARPLTEPHLIEQLIALVDEGSAGAIAASPATDTIKRVSPGERAIIRTEDRAELWAAQTPQVFRTDALRRAHARDAQTLAAATDDAMLLELAGEQVLIEPAPPTNLKVTTPTDLRLAELLLAER